MREFSVHVCFWSDDDNLSKDDFHTPESVNSFLGMWTRDWLAKHPNGKVTASLAKSFAERNDQITENDVALLAEAARKMIAEQNQ